MANGPVRSFSTYISQPTVTMSGKDLAQYLVAQNPAKAPEIWDLLQQVGCRCSKIIYDPQYRAVTYRFGTDGYWDIRVSDSGISVTTVCAKRYSCNVPIKTVFGMNNRDFVQRALNAVQFTDSTQNPLIAAFFQFLRLS